MAFNFSLPSDRLINITYESFTPSEKAQYKRLYFLRLYFLQSKNSKNSKKNSEEKEKTTLFKTQAGFKKL